MHSQFLILYLSHLPKTVCMSTAACPAEYRLVAKKGEGTFSEVLKAQCIKNSKYVAIKCMKNHFDSLEQASHLQSLLIVHCHWLAVMQPQIE